MSYCVNCGSPASHKCGGCDQSAYCGESCQFMDWEDTHQFECIGMLPEGAPKTYEDITKRQAYYERLLASERYRNPKGVADKLQSTYYKKMRDQMERSRLKQAASGGIDPQEGLSATAILDETQGSPRLTGPAPDERTMAKRESQARKQAIRNAKTASERSRLKEEHSLEQMRRGEWKKKDKHDILRRARVSKEEYKQDLKSGNYDKKTRLEKKGKYHERQQRKFKRFGPNNPKYEKHVYKSAAAERKLQIKNMGKGDKKARIAAKRAHLKEKKKFQKSQLAKHKEGSTKHAKATKKLANIKKRKGKLDKKY
jgi:hypothetical protein